MDTTTSPVLRRGAHSPTPSDFDNQHPYTPSSLSPPGAYVDADASLSVANQHLGDRVTEGEMIAIGGELNYSSSSEEGEDAPRRGTRLSLPFAAAGPIKEDTLPAAMQDPNKRQQAQPLLEDAIMHDPDQVLQDAQAPTAASAMTNTDGPQMVMHLFDHQAGQAQQPPLRQHIQFADRKEEAVEKEEKDISEAAFTALVALNDPSALKAFYERMRSALAIQKNLTAVLTEKATGLEQALGQQTAKLAEEKRARENAEEEAVKAADAAANAAPFQPLIVSSNGMPLVLSSPGLMRPVQSPARVETDRENNGLQQIALQQGTPQIKYARLEAPAANANAAIQVTSPSRQYFISPSKPLAAPAVASAAQQSKSNTQAARNLIRRNLYEPLARNNKLCKSYIKSIKADLSNFMLDMKETCKLVVGSIMNHSSINSDLFHRYQNERKLRKGLHNELLELRGNIRVFARIRPLMSNMAINASGGETGVAVAAAVNANSNSLLMAAPNDAGRIVQEIEQDATRYIDDYNLGHAGKVYEFDKILHQQSSQEEVYENVKPFIQSVVDGYPVCIFAYGQTGSGKTFTMTGPASNPGVNQRALTDLFLLLSRRPSDEYAYSVRMSAVEIYNEMPRDLMLEPAVYKKNLAKDQTSGTFGGGKDDPASDASASSISSSKLEIHQAADGSIFLPGLTEKTVKSVDEITQYISNYVDKNRSTAATSMNEYSSRSHSLIFINVESLHLKKGADGNETEKTTGRLVLIDLAGSERIKKSEAQGNSLKEATFINKSLSALGGVINALKSKAAHVPFRDSRLTWLLSDCLAGHAKVLMFAQISPSVSDQAESAATLAFAQRVRHVQLGPAVKHKRKAQENASTLSKLVKVESLLAERDAQLEKSQSELKKAREEWHKERAAQLQKSAQQQQSSSDQIRALEQEIANSKRHKHSHSADETTSHASAACTEHLNAIIRAKDREILELKLQRNQSTTSAVAPSRVPRIHAPSAAGASAVASSVPQVSAKGHAFTAVSAELLSPSNQQQQVGVNLLDKQASVSSVASDSTPAAAALFLAVNASFSLETGAGESDMQLQDVEDEDLQPPSLAKKQRDSLTGQKRKTSPVKAEENDVAEAAAQENALSTMVADENAMPSATAAPVVATKKSKVGILGVSTATLNVVPVAADLAAKPSAAVAAAKGGFKRPFTPSRPIRSRAANQLNISMDSPVPSKDNDSTLDASSLALVEQLSTPVPAAGGSKSVRFGGQDQIKFISPAAGNLIMGPSASGVAHAEPLRVKTSSRLAAASASAAANSAALKGSALSGGAKRTAVKSQQPQWNNNFTSK